MPRVFLSPSTQEGNEYVSGGTEEQYMNLLCDEVVPYLDSSGIRWTRNDPAQSAAAAIAQANAAHCGLYVALHSNGAPEGKYGAVRGSEVYYYPHGAGSRRAAAIFAEELRLVYPLPERVRTVPTTALGEVTRSRAPAVLLEIAYHDNAADAAWIKGSLPAIAYAVAKGIVRYFGLPLCAPMAPQPAVVILGAADAWDVVQYGSLTGYAAARYLRA